MIYTFDITPQPKPRMTQRDKWKNTRTDAAERYFQYRQDLQNLALINKFEPSDTLAITFYLPMAKKASAQIRELSDLQPHQLKPDISNLVKAFEDCLWEEDSTIWYTVATKCWTKKERGYIVVETDPLTSIAS